jgi:hypothetical protein
MSLLSTYVKPLHLLDALVQMPAVGFEDMAMLQCTTVSTSSGITIGHCSLKCLPLTAWPKILHDVRHLFKS